MSDVVLRHYSRSDVRSEIAEFCRGRWVAVEGSISDRRVFLRYLGRRPLTVRLPGEVTFLVRRFRGLNVRTFYATINVYKDLSRPELLDDLSNITATTPFWDIDTELDKWEYAVKAAQVICDFLESEGLSKSVYVLWSGEGAHVRISEKAFSRELLEENHPLDVAFAVAEYVLRSLRDKLEKIRVDSGGVLKVENLVDTKRVFTVPLSLHRRHDLVAVCLSPDDLSSFDLSWTNPDGFKHKSMWRNYDEGEGDELAKKALKVIGRAKTVLAMTRSTRIGDAGRQVSVARRTTGSQKLGRFQVMALLQAARYYLLTSDLEKAKSFGLNRAIFYAWAKHYGRQYIRRMPYRYISTGQRVSESEKKLAKVAGEEAFVSPRGWFVMGDQEQLPEDYDKNVVKKIEEVIPYEVAWEAALKYLGKFPRQALLDPRRFYEEVYEPVRDYFIEKVVKKYEEPEEEKKEKARAEEKTVSRPEGVARIQEKQRTLFDWIRGKSRNDDKGS